MFLYLSKLTENPKWRPELTATALTSSCHWPWEIGICSFGVNCKRENTQVHSAASLKYSCADKGARTGSILAQHFHKAGKKKRGWKATLRSPRFCQPGEIKLQKPRCKRYSLWQVCYIVVTVCESVAQGTVTSGPHGAPPTKTLLIISISW